MFVAEPAANLVSRIIVERRRHDAARAEGVRTGRVPRVDRRALPSRLPVGRSRRHACTSSTCIAASSSSAPTSPSTCAITSSRHKLEQPNGLRAHLSRRARDDAARPEADAVDGDRRRSSSRRCRIRTAGGATRRSGCSSSAAIESIVPALTKLGREREGLADAAARAVDARRDRQARSGAGDQGAGRSVARRARVGDPALGAVARASRESHSGRGVEADGRRGLGRAETAGGVARRAAARAARDGARRAARTVRGRSDGDGCGAQRRARRRSGGARERWCGPAKRTLAGPAKPDATDRLHSRRSARPRSR